MICFFADHGDMLGDHHAWQKESYFEASCHVPFLVSWPARLPTGQCRDELVCLTDLLGIATHAAGAPEPRDGIDVLAMLDGDVPGREYVVGYYGRPGTPRFKTMIREGDWKYIFLANGGREQLFNVTDDPHELTNLAAIEGEVRAQMRRRAVEACSREGATAALADGALRGFAFEPQPPKRIYQFDSSRGVRGFPANPEDVLKGRS